MPTSQPARLIKIVNGVLEGILREALLEKFSEHISLANLDLLIAALTGSVEQHLLTNHEFLMIAQESSLYGPDDKLNLAGIVKAILDTAGQQKPAGKAALDAAGQHLNFIVNNISLTGVVKHGG